MDRDPAANAVDPVERTSDTTGASETGTHGDDRARDEAARSDKGRMRDEQARSEKGRSGVDQDDIDNPAQARADQPLSTPLPPD